MNKKITPVQQSGEKTFTWADFKLNSDGMVPVIAQDYETGEVLMLAYMNEEAYNTTVETGKMTYWSRSRNELWTKGLTSGHLQYVKSLTLDCDNDTILPHRKPDLLFQTTVSGLKMSDKYEIFFVNFRLILDNL